MNGTLAITADQETWTPQQLAALNAIGIAAPPTDMALLLHHCQRTGVDPWARQIYLVSRKTKNGIVHSVQMSIDGMRLAASRADERTGGGHSYEETLWCGSDGVWQESWLSTAPPLAAKVCVVRDGHRFPVVAHLQEYQPVDRDGVPVGLWGRMPALMLAKCAEALALRRAYAKDLSGLYTADEMAQANTSPAQASSPLPSGEAVPAQPLHHPATAPQLAEMRDLMAAAGMDGATALALAREAAEKPELASATELSAEEANRVLERLRETNHTKGTPAE